MMYLFTSIEYSAGGKVMETLKKPGQTTSMLGYLTYPDDFNTSVGLMQCWSKDTTNNANSHEFTESPAVAAGAAAAAGLLTPRKNPNYNQGFATRRSLLLNAGDNVRGNFAFIIPFSHIFGFSEYNKVMYNIKHSLRFTRATNNLAIHKADNNIPDGRIELTHIAWRFPRIEPSVETRTQLLQSIIDKKSYIVDFSGRSDQHTIVPQGVTSFDWRLSVISGIEKPRWIIIGFQTDKNANQTQNPTVFDHINLERAYVQLNGARYPRDDVTVNFADNRYVIHYKMADNFKRDYYGINNLIGGSQINLATYKSLFPLLVFDVKNQSETLSSGVVDMTLQFYFREGVPANTRAYAVIISDRLFKLQSDGTNMKMVSY